MIILLPQLVYRAFRARETDLLNSVHVAFYHLDFPRNTVSMVPYCSCCEDYGAGYGRLSDSVLPR